jgi:dipeptidyl aminopeptidase/acylaminoacyl peptidase
MLLETIDLSGLAISPDGRNVAFRVEQASVERNTYETRWMVQALDDQSSARRVADGGAPLRYDVGSSINEPPQWSPDGRWIYYRALLGGEVQVWRAASDGSRAERVTQDPADIEAFTLSRDGEKLIYTVGATRAAIERAEEHEYDQGVLIDKTVPLGQGLFRSGFINGRLATERMTGDWMARAGLLADQPTHRVIVDLATLESSNADTADLRAFQDILPVTQLKAAPPGPYDAYLRARSPTSSGVAFAEPAGGKMTLHAVASVDDPTSVTCDAAPCRSAVVDALAWRPGRQEVVFTTFDRDRGHAQSLYDWNIQTGAVRLIARANGLINGGRPLALGEACAVAAQAAACVTASADEPPQLERIDLETGARRVLYAPNGTLAQQVGPRATLLVWRDSQGQTYTGQFFPAIRTGVGERTPLFINYYTCSGYLRGGAGDEWPLASLAGAGIAALCIDEPPVDPFHLDQVARYNMALRGVRSVVALLSQRGLIDPSRVGMGGLSFGSEVVNWLAMKSDLLAAASVSSTSVTPTYYELHSLQTPGFQKMQRSVWGLGSPAESPDRWKLLSPAFNIDKIHVPLLMQMPEQEYLSALDYFVPLANAARPVELYVFPNEPHQKFQPRHQLAVYNRNLDWFRFWLQGYVDSDPLKALQYDRWEAMRSRARSVQPNRSPEIGASKAPG